METSAEAENRSELGRPNRIARFVDGGQFVFDIGCESQSESYLLGCPAVIRDRGRGV